MESKRILVVAADPEFTTEEFLDEETETISGALDRGDGEGSQFQQLRTLQRGKFFKTVGEFLPNIVHFTTRGSPNQHVIMEDARGWLRKVTGPTLMKGLQSFDVHLDYCFFSNCTVFNQLNALKSVAKYVVSARAHSEGVDMSEVITETFYSSMSGRNTFENAIQLFQGAISKELSGVDVRLGSEGGRQEDVLVASDLPQPVRRQRSVESKKGASSGFGRAANKQFVDGGKKDPRLYRVWFGTNRALIDKQDYSKGFGSQRSKHLSYGFCDVSVPKNHETGSLGDPWWKRWPLFKADNRLKLREINVLSEEDYWQHLRELYVELSDDENNLLIFIHGYNVTFTDAAIRAAQLGFDLKVRGATAFFSWPSKGSIKSYPADVASLEASEEALGSFVMEMARRSGARNIHLIAHSMGNKGLLRAFENLSGRLEKAIEKPFQQILLAAPDVDTELFKRLAGVYAQMGERTTMYVSDKDKALMSSGIIHEAPRAGYTPPVTVIGGIDTIEVSQIDLTFLGHGYIAEARELLNDMHALIETNLAPRRRFSLEGISVENGLPYWTMKK